ncbi:MAG: hypothetical protein ABJC19_02755 [Gemmatimonadota bacterium]
MRAQFAVLVLLGALPLGAQDAMITAAADAVPYVPVRPGQSYTAGFLSEQRLLPYGTLRGAVTPPEITASVAGAIIMVGTTLSIVPPAGASYTVGDTLMLAHRSPGPKGWGEIVTPTGLARVTESQTGHALATLLEVYGPVREGQVTLPLEPVPNPGAVMPVKITGPRATMIAPREPRELLQPADVIFIDAGRAAGMRLGDFVEVRRKPAKRINAPDQIDELMATGQVVAVNEKHSSVVLVRVVAPDIAPGTPVIRVATLPN